MKRRYPFLLQSPFLLVAALTISATLSARADDQPNLQTFNQEIRPLIGKYCVKCHRGKTPEANIVLDEIDADIIDGEHFDRWEDIR